MYVYIGGLNMTENHCIDYFVHQFFYEKEKLMPNNVCSYIQQMLLSILTVYIAQVFGRECLHYPVRMHKG